MLIIKNNSEQPGPTDDFPNDKLCAGDEGGLKMGFRIEIGLNNQSIIIVDFGKEKQPLTTTLSMKG